MVFLKFHTVGTRTVVETVDPRVADELDQVLITLIVFGQNDEVVATQVLFCLLQTLIATTGYIHLTTEDRLERLETFFFAVFIDAVANVVKFLNAEHIAMIGDGHSLHAVGNSLIHKLLDTRLTIEYGVVGMYV